MYKYYLKPAVLFLCFALTALSSTSYANNKQGEQAELLYFSSDVMRIRYYDLIDELRCPKCQNQNLADSNAELAVDLKNELYQLLLEGYSDTEILEFMTARYGEFVLYKPPLSIKTLVLWGLPLLFVLGGIAVLVRLVFNNQRHNKDASQDLQKTSAEKTVIDKDREVQKLLDEYDANE